MASTGLDVFDQTLQQTNIWLNDIGNELHREEAHTAYLALRATLHALRDNLTIDEAADLAAQLPMLIRGIYFDGWNPAIVPVLDRSRTAFLARIDRAMDRAQPDFPAEHAARAVFHTLSSHVSQGEIDEVRNTLTEEIRELWT